MADLYRVMRLACYFVAGLFLGAFTVFAHAETIPASLVPDVEVQGFMGSTGPASTNVAACQQPRWPGFSYVSVSGLVCTYSNGSTTQVAYISRIYYCKSNPANYSYAPQGCPGQVYTCPAGNNWTLSGANCTRPDCVAPQVLDPSTGVCGAPPCPAAGTIAPTNARSGTPGNIGWNNAAYTTGYKNFGAAKGCYGGCAVQSQTSACVKYLGTDYNCGMFGVTYTGGNCTGSEQTIPAAGATPNTPEDRLQQQYNCAMQGMGSGTVNGVVICTGSAPPSNPSTPPTTGTNTTPTSTTNTTSTTSCTVEGSCTTTINTTTISGGSGPNGTGAGSTESQSSSTETSSKDEFCSKNPNSTVCKDPTPSTFSGGDCVGSPPACTGDAVQCAQATAAWQIKCEISTEPTSASYNTGKIIANGGADPLGNPLSADKETTIDVGSIVSTAAGQRTLTGNCIASPSFSVMGRSFTFDTTLFCQFAGIVGYLMVAAASVIAIRMVTSGAA